MASRRTVSNNFLGTNLNKFRRDGTMCDVKLKAGGKTFHAHRLVLSAASVYYRTMFEVEMKEKISGEVKLKGITPETLESCLEFIYTGQVHITDGNVYSLMETGSLQQIEELKSACMDYMHNHITAQACLKSLAMAKLYENKGLERMVSQFILRHLSEVKKDKEFNKTIDQTTLAQLMGMYSILHPGQDSAYQVVMSWVKFDEQKREKFLPELLHHVGLENFSPQFLAEEAEKNVLLKGNGGCQKIVQEAMKQSNLNQSSRKRTYEKMQGANIPEAEKTEIVIAETGSNSVLSFNPQSRQWKDYPKAPSRISYCIVVGDKIYVLCETEACMYFLEEGEECWKRTSPFIGSGVAAAAILGGKIYAGCRSSFWCYEPESDRWMQKEDMNMGSRCYSLSGIKGRLYAIDFQQPHRVKIWSENTWISGSQSPVNREFYCMAVFRGKIYALGESTDGGKAVMSMFGETSNNRKVTGTLDIYDTDMDVWCAVTGFTDIPRSISSMCVVNSVIYVTNKDDTDYSIKYVDFKKKAILPLPTRMAKWTGASIAAR